MLKMMLDSNSNLQSCWIGQSFTLSLWLVSSHELGAQSSGFSSLISPDRTSLLDRAKRGNLVMKIMFQMNQSPCQAIGIWRVNHNT